MKSGLEIKIDNFAKAVDGIALMATTRVMVGVPAEKSARKEGGPISNADLAYIHENGSPEAGIPARPFLKPGIQAEEEEILEGFRKTGIAALEGGRAAAERGFHRVGLIGKNAVRAKINEGPPPPLAESTLRERARRGKKGRKGAKQELANRASGLPASTELAKPLIDTGGLRNSLTYVIRTAK